MQAKWSMQRKMTSLLIVFGVLPLCVMACVMLSLRWQAYVSERVQHNQYILDNVAADARMFAAQTENVVRTLADNESLAEMLSARSGAEWSIIFNDEVYLEISKAEMYLQPLNVNIMVIFDRSDFSLEHWAMLLNADRFENDASYQDFVKSGKYADWDGVGSVMPESMTGVYDFRNINEKFAYYCWVNAGVDRNLGVIKCSVDTAPFIQAALTRAAGNAVYIITGNNMLYASDDEYREAQPEFISSGGFVRSNGSLWQCKNIDELDVQVVLRTDVRALLLEYASSSSGMVLLIIAAIFLLFFIAKRVLGNLLTRLNHIAVVADSINTKDGRVHLPEAGEDEVGLVVRAFNSLFDRLDKQMVENIGKEKVKRHMQALALQYQLNPHFLFNSLSWLQMELEDQGVEARVSRSITRLGSVLRYNLSESLQSTLKQEAELLQSYIDFMCEMKRQHITLSMQWAPELDDAIIPRFLLQPLVENALQHGLIRGEDMAVQVNVLRIADTIRFCIVNDGRTIEEDRLALLRDTFENPGTGTRGVGISNLVQRLRLQYGDGFDISVSSHARRTEFVIEIPMKAEVEQR